MSLKVFAGEDNTFGRSKVFVVLALALALASIVVLDGLSRRVTLALKANSKDLLSADIQVRAFRPFSPEVWKAVAAEQEAGNLVHQRDFLSTIRSSDAAFTVNVRSIQGLSYPIHGKLKTTPAVSVAELHEAPVMLVDSALIAQGLELGSTVDLGRQKFRVAAVIDELPQSVIGSFGVGPRVVIGGPFTDSTGLVSGSARVSQQLLIKTDENPSDWRARFRKAVPEPHWRVVTPEQANRQHGLVVGRFSTYLLFISAVASLLGAASLVMLLRSQLLQRLPQIMTLRCLGVGRKRLVQSALVTMVPMVGLSLVLGIALGQGILDSLSGILAEQIKVILPHGLVWQSWILAGAVAIASSLFAVMLPMLTILRIPLGGLVRGEVDSFVPLKGSEVAILILGVLGLLAAIVRDVVPFLGLSAALVGLFLLQLFLLQVVFPSLQAVSERTKSLIVALSVWGVMRQKLRTRLFVATLGLCAFLLSFAGGIGVSLYKQFSLAQTNGSPTMFVLGLEHSQLESLKQKVPGLRGEAIVQARLISLDGQEIRVAANEDDTEALERRFESREYTLAVRNELGPAEALAGGSTVLFGEAESGVARISLEEEFAERIGLEVGQRLEIEVAGVRLAARVDSLRVINWASFLPNFFILVNQDDLVGAPLGLVAYGTTDESAIPALQREISATFLGASVINAAALSKKLLESLSMIALAIVGLMAVLVLSSLLVVFGFLFSREADMKRESILYRALGLSRRNLNGLYLSDLFLSASLASGSGLLAGFIGGIATLVFVMDTPIKFIGFGLGALVVLAMVMVLAVGTSLYLNRWNKASVRQLEVDS